MKLLILFVISAPIVWSACGVKKPPTPIYTTSSFEEPARAPDVTPTPSPKK
ncbi:MAG: hypothetical protein JST80_08095 [Bdellovibrionales bacterium]|nr:hypothetical protein [Bdellovibrionales bacterium]